MITLGGGRVNRSQLNLFNIDDEEELRFDDDNLNSQSQKIFDTRGNKRNDKKQSTQPHIIRQSSEIENTLKKLKQIRNNMNELKNNNQ